MPDGADRLWRAISGRARLDVLRTLLVSGPMTSRALTDETGLSAATIQTVMSQLEALEYVTASHPVGRRKGKPVVYTVDESRFDDDMRLLSAWLGRDLS